MSSDHSRSISRASTPGPRPSPSRLAIAPSLRPSPSLSNLHVHSQKVPNITEQPSFPPIRRMDHFLDSSASSVIDMDMHEGILIQDIDADVEHTDSEDTQSMDKTTSLEREEGDSSTSKRLLRDQLRRSLSQRAHNEVAISRARLPDKQPTIEQLAFSEGSRYMPREYFILTDAGKPVFISRPGGEDQDGMTSTIGIMQALISVFLDDGDKLRSIVAGRTRITFLLRPPLYHVCVSAWGEPESVARSHLEHLHLQILSIVTGSQLKRIFERRTNFDLRRLLNGAETLMNSLLHKLESDLAITMSSLQCLKLEPALRRKIAESIVPNSKIKADTLYIMLVASNRFYPSLINFTDLHIVLNTIHAPSVVNSLASASWIPICLPKFNPSNFVNACIKFLRRDGESVESGRLHEGASDDTDSDAGKQASEAFNDSKVALVLISTGNDFDLIREWSESAKLIQDGALAALVNAIQSRQTEYSVSELAVPGLRHFIYKSRTQVQVTLPIFEDPYDQPIAHKRLVTLYQTLHDAIHAKSGQESGLKLQYIRTESESVMGWSVFTRTLLTTTVPRVPPKREIGENITTPSAFLKAIGRESEKKVTSESWEEFWKLDGSALKIAGIAVRDRRYILWCMQKYRLGFPLGEFVHEASPKKTIRGWGPKVQNGKRIRSRRIKDKTKKIASV
ncbi:hypothetical protein CVT24_010950 [Panaeolus cyanescens]|uniref:Vacuolar fusion protein MON1 n=1 Tax=Panaeolus cyanescens TaxID=181874 RepID=A0A409YVR8_9AGAR|nr:hypothetical protein CVT24_010950 [Panaeolus cyanescens]